MRWYLKVLIFYILFIFINTIIITEDGDFATAFTNVITVFFSGYYDGIPDASIGKAISYPILTIVGLITEFLLIGVVVMLFLRYIISIQFDLRRITELISVDLPYRQILIGFFLSVSILSTILFKFVENVTWINAIYFTFATITTVGYGDVVATQPLTKLVAIVLIINGISGLAIASQVIVNRIVSLQLQTRTNVPAKPLDWDHHVIIGGYGSKGRKLVQYFLDRQYKVVVIDINSNRIPGISYPNLKIINADITKSSLLKLLSLNKSAGLFLVLSEDNHAIQAGIIAKSIAPDLNVYAEMMTVPTYNIARYAGINRPISLFHFLLNVINANIRHHERFMLVTPADMKTYEGQLGFVIVPNDFEYRSYFSEVIVLGYVNLFVNEFFNTYDPNLMDRIDELELLRSEAKDNSHLLLAIDKEELLDKQKSEIFENKAIAHRRVVFAGFPDFADEFINRLGIGPENTIILWQKPEEREILDTKEYTNFQWTMENGIGLLERIIKDNDLVICTFEDITSSMLVGVTLKNMDVQTHLVQLAPYEFDIEPLVQIGAEAVITPQRIISEAMINTFARNNHLAPSIIFTNGHVFEHLIYENDSFDGKKIADLYSKNIVILFINREYDTKFLEAMPNERLNANDRIIVYVPY